MVRVVRDGTGARDGASGGGGWRSAGGLRLVDHGMHGTNDRVARRYLWVAISMPSRPLIGYHDAKDCPEDEGVGKGGREGGCRGAKMKQENSDGRGTGRGQQRQAITGSAFEAGRLPVRTRARGGTPGSSARRDGNES